MTLHTALAAIGEPCPYRPKPISVKSLGRTVDDLVVFTPAAAAQIQEHCVFLAAHIDTLESLAERLAVRIKAFDEYRVIVNPCPECSGFGHTASVNYGGKAHEGKPYDYLVDCVECNGDGVVPSNSLDLRYAKQCPTCHGTGTAPAPKPAREG